MVPGGIGDIELDGLLGKNPSGDEGGRREALKRVPLDAVDGSCVLGEVS